MFGAGRWERRIAVSAITAVALAGCGKPQVANEAITQVQSALAVPFSVVTPTGDPKATLLSASDSLTVDDRVTIGTTALEIAAAFGSSTQTTIAAGVQAHANVTSKATIWMGSSSTIYGSAKSGSTISKQLGARVLGTETQNASITGIPTQWTVGFPDTNSGDVTLAPDATTTLAPGSYGNLIAYARSKVYLSAGTYYFLSIDIEPTAQVFLDKTAGPIFIYVKTGFTLKGPFVHNGGLEGEELVGYMGTTVAYIEVPLLGTIVAPNATIELRRPPDNSPHRGAAFGKAVHIFSDAKIQRLPFSWSFLCPLGDSDGDGVNDCLDGCPKDKNKTAPKQCGCGKPDTDTDKDGVADCNDRCPKDPFNVVPGQCGCNFNNPAPTGTFCTDTRCPLTPGTTATCNGAGVCGDPTSCMPGGSGSNCFPRTFDDKQYWVCPGPVTWSTAVANCRAMPNRTLIRVNTSAENDFLNATLTGGAISTAWTGANAQAAAGTWRWASPTTNNGDQFWTGGSTGSRVANRYTRWAGGQPDTAFTCGAINSAGEWIARSCTLTAGYVCEEQIPMNTRKVPPLNCGTFFPARACQTVGGDAPNCVQASDFFGSADKQQTYDQIAACNAAGENGTCTDTNRSGCDAACQGAATVPPADAGTCPAFEDEEKGFCGLQDIQTTNCTAGQDCCHFTQGLPVSGGVEPQSQAVLPETFSASAAGFTYQDDAFRGTGPAAPNYESGTRVTTGGNTGAALQVLLGGIDATTQTNMSGGWALTVNLASESLVVISFDYNLTQTPNYESNEQSRVLLSVDNNLRGMPFNDYVDQVVGDGDGGPNITTGWKSFTRNLGLLPAGAHTIRIGGSNSQKNATNEQTTLLFDNVIVQTRSDDCAATYQCGPVYLDGSGNLCNPCDERDPVTGGCSKDCGDPVLRCGHPIQNAPGANPEINPGGQANCSDNGMFPANELCQKIELCSDPSSTGNSDPTTGGSLGASPPFDPATLGAASAPVPNDYPPDPACGSTNCSGVGQAHNWCHYDVANPTQPRNTPAAGKNGSSGSSAITFSFTPDSSFSMSTNPAAFGENDFHVDTSASFLANVAFHIGGPVPDGSIDIINAALALHADRCNVNNDASSLTILEKDFFPSSLKVKVDPAVTTGCNDAVADLALKVKRVKKAYRDAIELVRQYKLHQTAGTRFPTTFCQDLVGNPPPAGFPAGDCTTESAEATINRFIQFYRDEITNGLRPAFQKVYDAAQLHFPLDAPLQSQRNEQTIFEATFPIGPIPLTLEVGAFIEYGLQAGLSFDITPLAQENGSSDFSPLVYVNGQAGPYALAGVSLFVGVGFGVNGFKVSAGVEGAITLGRLALNAHAGAGFGVLTTPDPRGIPSDVAAAGPLGIQDTKQTLFPSGGPKQYALALKYDYGLAVGLDQIMAGTISARLRIKFFFFSKTWRKVLLRFPGFSLGAPINLLSGGGTFPAIADDPAVWGTIAMPLPFIELANLRTDTPLPPTGTAVALDTTVVDKFFYDSLCQCKLDNQACVRPADCCTPGASCFSDPFGVVPDGSPPGTKFCTSCRNPGDSCNVNTDCCGNPNSICLPDHHCSCVNPGGACSATANCCTGVDGGTFSFLTCGDDPNTPDPTHICRTCLHEFEKCTSASDCCSDVENATCSTVDGGTDTVCVHHHKDPR